MTVQRTGIVDWLTIDPDMTTAALVVVDDVDWGDEHAHLHSLQEKLNTYLAFVEGGEAMQHIAQMLGDRAGGDLRIEVRIIARYELPPAGQRFLEYAQGMFEGAGLALTFQVKSYES